MSTGSISLDILLNKILTDAISGGNESIRAIQKRYPSLSEKEAHEILAMVSATAQSNDDSAELVVRRKKGFYVTGTVRYKAPYDEKVHDGSLY